MTRLRLWLATALTRLAQRVAPRKRVEDGRVNAPGGRA